MNKLRRKQLSDLMEKISALRDEVKSIMNEEEEYRDNIPENLQGSERYEKADASCDSLSEALDAMDSAVENIEAAAE